MDKAGETLEREGTRKAGGSLADFSQRGGAAVDAAPRMDGGRKPALRRYPGESMRKQGLHRALGLPEGQGDAAFSDVRAGAWYAEAVRWAVGAGVTNGVGEGRFAPDETCTRAEIVTFLWRSYNG